MKAFRNLPSPKAQTTVFVETLYREKFSTKGRGLTTVVKLFCLALTVSIVLLCVCVFWALFEVQRCEIVWNQWEHLLLLQISFQKDLHGNLLIKKSHAPEITMSMHEKWGGKPQKIKLKSVAFMSSSPSSTQAFLRAFTLIELFF